MTMPSKPKPKFKVGQVVALRDSGMQFGVRWTKVSFHRITAVNDDGTVELAYAEQSRPSERAIRPLTIRERGPELGRKVKRARR